MLIDTHVHFDELLRETNMKHVLDRAQAHGVHMMVAVGGSTQANEQAVGLAHAYHDCIKAAVGYNRDQVSKEFAVNELTAFLSDSNVVAIGESGLDFHHDIQTKDAQLLLFQQMLEKAREYHLPIIVHSRDAEDATIALLSDHAQTWSGSRYRPGVLHCFTGSKAFARRLLDLGFFISFSGILTFKNAQNLREVAGMIPDDRILIETDSPWLTPEPFRGKRNEPAHVRQVAEILAGIRHCSFETIATITCQNTERLFSNKN